MSLRRKDDWDEATEEAHKRRIVDGCVGVKHFIPGPDYDYTATVVVTLEELMESPNHGKN
jgi:hypothetical protein